MRTLKKYTVGHSNLFIRKEFEVSKAKITIFGLWSQFRIKSKNRNTNSHKYQNYKLALWVLLVIRSDFQVFKNVSSTQHNIMNESTQSKLNLWKIMLTDWLQCRTDKLKYKYMLCIRKCVCAENVYLSTNINVRINHHHQISQTHSHIERWNWNWYVNSSKHYWNRNVSWAVFLYISSGED